MGMKQERTRGRCGRLDCFALEDGLCSALKAEYIHEECGFYKNTAEWAAENEVNAKTLKEKGQYDLIDKYSAAMDEITEVKLSGGEIDVW